MTDKPTNRQSAGIYHLRTFGTLALTGPAEDGILGKHGQQRGRLALLAVLAAAGEQGRTRDQLLLLFWPDATQARARHSLEQLLYSIRTSIDQDVFTGVNPVHLNPDVVSSDVELFQHALERDDLESAVEHYRAPFLDGFYLSDAPEFEQWLEAERARLRQAYSGALERLAQRADVAVDHASAVRWWRKLADADPVSSKSATGLMRGLINSGDYAAALQYAERYEAIVSKELGTSVGPAVTALVAEARAKTRSEPVTGLKPRRPLPAPASDRALPPTDAPPPLDQPPSPSLDEQPSVSLARPQSRHPWTRRSATYAAGATVILLVTIAAALWRRESRASGVPATILQQSIAVLPFANVSGDSHDAPFVDGLSEEFIAVLSKIPNLRVIARTSAFAFRNSNAGVRAIADSLHVSNILEGGVQKVGSHIRVEVRLIDGSDGSTRWSETYDRQATDIFAVQSDIAGSVARELDLRLGQKTLARIQRGSTPSVAAYELYLRGNDPVLTRSDSAVRLGLNYFRQAIELDSTYADAYAGAARLHLRFGTNNETRRQRRIEVGLAEQAALKAVALDDSSAEAHASLSLVRKVNFDLPASRTELLRAIALEPTNARFHEWFVTLDVLSENPSEALVEARRAVELDPLSPTANAELAHALLANGRCGEALAQLASLKALRPPLLRAGNIAAQCYAHDRMWPQAIAEVQPGLPNSGLRGQAVLGYLLGRAGRTGEARQILASQLDRAMYKDGPLFGVAMVYAGLGDNDQAFNWLDKALDDRSLDLENLPVILEALRGDPRLESFRRRAGLQNR